MINVLEEYKKYCLEEGIKFHNYKSIKSFDKSTLFCSAGMQRYKKHFKNEFYHGTIANNQQCLRLNDIDKLGDGNHLASFNMLGLFSFREWSIESTILFWRKFISRLGLKIDKVTIHPEMFLWREYYPEDIKVELDKNCVWSDGEIKGYCTEFYVNGIEIGNIVNPLGGCIDVGFGLERLDQLVNDTKPKPRMELLIETANLLIKEGFKPSNKEHGYVLRKILRTIYKEKGLMDHKYFKEEIERQKKILDRYLKLKDKYKNMSKEWWLETHGINLDDLK